jgi:putative phosphoribosyl transferase
MLFHDRKEAGASLAEALMHYRDAHPVVVGLPRGGIPVAAEIARRLSAPLDLIIVRKIGCPWQPEYAIGALATGVTVLNDEEIRALGIRPDQLNAAIASERRELERREAVYRKGRGPLDVRDRVVILVDDGLATGTTALAAIKALRQLGPRRIIFAAPVCAPDSATNLGRHADEVICLRLPPQFRAVGLHYDDFTPTTDAEVLACLEGADAVTTPAVTGIEGGKP